MAVLSKLSSMHIICIHVGHMPEVGVVTNTNAGYIAMVASILHQEKKARQ